MTDHDGSSGGLRGRVAGMGRFTRLSAAAVIVVLGAGVFQASSSSASNTPTAPVQSSATAAQQQQQQQIQQVNGMLAAAPAGYKATLEQQFMQLAAVTSRYPADYKTSINMPAALQQAAKDVEVLNDQQLAVLYRQFSKVPAWNGAAAKIVAIEKVKAHLRSAIARQAAYHANLVRGHDFNPVPPNDCTTPAFAASIYALIGVHIIAEGVATGLEKFGEGTPDSFVVGAIVLGEGIIFTFPISPIREPTEIAQGVLELIGQAAQGAKELMDACNQDDFEISMDAFKNYTHAYVPLKTLTLRAVPYGNGTTFYLTGTEDGIPVPLTLDKVYALTPTGPTKETDITLSVSLTPVDTANGVYQFSVPTTVPASGYVLKAESSFQTDPTSSDPGQTHTGIVTFTKNG